jgi:pyridinium-3,5-bisthiocarboxylic acid mononucleotide nickel chelatase
MSLLYIDCIAGVAGDMLLGALLDAGADAGAVRRGLDRLGVAGLALEVQRTEQHGIGAAHTTVRGAAGQPHRTWASIRAQIDAAGFTDRVRARALAVFERLARAEGAVHGVDPEDVHFHEVGAVDAIGEVCGVALALESLNVERAVCSPLPLGRGFVAAAHGRLPLPAPATLELLKGTPVVGADVDAELVTPTGAALVAGLCDAFGGVPAMTLAASGYGAGTRRFAHLPNVTRVLVGEPAGGTAPSREAVVIEANLDDLLPELVPDAAAACFAAGALDVWVTPVQMKRGRPGFVLSALARPCNEDRVVDAILRETSTLGVRITRARRRELERAHRTVVVAGEPVRVKLGLRGGAVVNIAPEHADCERAARRAGLPVKVVWARALAHAQTAEVEAAVTA